MEGFTPYSDACRELDDLRRMAYGRHPDIDVDPAALARLRELEAAHRADAALRADSVTSAGVTGIARTAAPTQSIRFMLHRNAVDAYVHLTPESDL